MAVYGLVMRALQPVLRRKLQRRGQQETGYLRQVSQRFGVYDTPATAGAVWVHAVSLGETRAAALLVNALRQQLPGMRLLLTHSTATGWAQGQALLQPGDVQAWLPWDTPQATRQFLEHHQPRCGILMETEVWPSLVQACHVHAVPLFLANARLNDKSFRSARRWAWLAGPAYRGLSAVLAQSPADAERLRALGAPVQAVLGNLKFDVQPQPEAQVRAQIWRSHWTRQDQSRPVIMLASTREGEEALWLNALASNELSISEVGVINISVVLLTYLLENIWLMKHETRKTINYERIDLIKPENYDLMKADLEKRTGLTINRVEVGKIDFLNDTAMVRIYYFADEQEYSDYHVQ